MASTRDAVSHQKRSTSPGSLFKRSYHVCDHDQIPSSVKRQRSGSASSTDKTSDRTESTCLSSRDLNRSVCQPIFDGYETVNTQNRSEHQFMKLPAYHDDRSTPSLSNIPQQIRDRIIGYILPSANVVKPFYAKGMHTEPLGPAINNDDQFSSGENINTTLLRLNRSLHEQATHILYSNNQFQFENPQLFHWWLKRIGTRNISKLRDLDLYLGTGWRSEPQSDLIGCDEEYWTRSLQYLRHRHQLTFLQIAFCGWNILEPTDLQSKTLSSDHMIAEITSYRHKTVEQLKRIRNIRHVRIFQLDCSCFNQRYIEALTAHIQQQDQQYQYRYQYQEQYQLLSSPPTPNPQYVSLSDLVEILKQRRLRRVSQTSRKARIRNLRRFSRL